MSTGNVGPYTNLPVVYANRAAEEATKTEPTAEEIAFATQYPAGPVELERKGLKLGLQIPGGLMALGGAALLGISLLSRRPPGAAESRLLASPLMIGGGLIGAGAASVIGAELLPPKTKIAVASGLPTRAKAGEFAGKMVGREYSIEQDTKGKWAVFDEGPLKNTRGYEYGRGHSYGHGSHYDDYYRTHGHYEPYYPGHNYDRYYPDYPTSYPDPWYPIPSGGSTSRGDDYDYSPSYPSTGSGGTSRGDDGGGSYNPPPSSYDPPSYDPPSYDPPSYDPPSYDPPSYDPPSYDYGGGNSSSNGNPDYDDF